MTKLPNRRDVLQASVALAAGGLFAATPAAAAIDPIRRTGPSKMKLSCAAYSFRDQLTGKKEPKWTLDDFIDFCAANGLEGTELTSYYFPKEITPEYLAHLKHRTFLLGLDISGTAISNNFCMPPGDARDREIAKTKLWTDHAASLGAPCIRIFSGGVPKGLTEEDARRWCVECIEECCQYAAGKGVFLALENHGGISATADSLLAVVRAVRSPWFGVNLDTGNFHTSDPYGDIAKVAPYAVTVQVKTEMAPAGSTRQRADMAKIIGILHDVRYRGYVALEYEAAEDPNIAVPRQLAELRKLVGS